MFLTGNPRLEWYEDTTATLLEEVIYQDSDITYTVPAGFVTDGASVPRAVSWLYPKYGVYLKAAILHDYLIEKQLPLGEITSTRVDELFREAMASLDIPKVRQWLMWAGVRIGAIGNKKRRKGSLKTFPKVLLVCLIASPVVLVPSLAVQIMLTVMWLVSAILPKRQKITAQKV